LRPSRPHATLPLRFKNLDKPYQLGSRLFESPVTRWRRPTLGMPNHSGPGRTMAGDSATITGTRPATAAVVTTGPSPSAPPAPPPAARRRPTRPEGAETARTYALVGSLAVFFLAWAVIAGHPWTGPAALPGPDPRVRMLAGREQHLRAEIPKVRGALYRRFNRYQAQVAKRTGASPRRGGPVRSPRRAAPPVAVIWVGGQPVARTRSS
jgi:hypothetical protein